MILQQFEKIGILDLWQSCNIAEFWIIWKFAVVDVKHNQVFELLMDKFPIFPNNNYRMIIIRLVLENRSSKLFPEVFPVVFGQFFMTLQQFEKKIVFWTFQNYTQIIENFHIIQNSAILQLCHRSKIPIFFKLL